MDQFIGKGAAEKLEQFGDPLATNVLERGGPEALGQPGETVSTNHQRHILAGEPTIDAIGDRLDLGGVGTNRVRKSWRGDRRGFRHLSQGSLEILTMGTQSSASIRPHALAGKIETGPRTSGIGSQVEGEETTGHRLLMEPMAGVDETKAVVLKEQT